jgi:hypothetical protein
MAPIREFQPTEPRPPALSARAVHREQVWAALIRAVETLLAETTRQLEDDAHHANLRGDEERARGLTARIRVLEELRREVLAPPPEG